MTGYGYWQKIIKGMRSGDGLVLEPNGRNKANGFYLAARSLGYKAKKQMLNYEKFSVTLIK